LRQDEQEPENRDDHDELYDEPSRHASSCSCSAAAIPPQALLFRCPRVACSTETFEPAGTPRPGNAVLNGPSCGRRKVRQKVYVVQRQESHAQPLAGNEEVPQVRPAEGPARIAGAFGVEGTRVEPIARPLDVDLP